MSRTDRWDADDLIAADAEAKRYPALEVSPGIVLTHRGSGTRGKVVAFAPGERILLEDPGGSRHEFKPHDGAFAHRGVAVTLKPSRTEPITSPSFTASGSLDAGRMPARVARASRIWVEGTHDAELIERIWGDDLRVEGIVVEPMHGADDLPDRVRSFHASPQHRLGILLDHLVEGSKESRIAAAIAGPHVLVTGHPYVDIWQAIRPEVVGIVAWPDVPPDRPWKEGVVAALGRNAAAGEFWQATLAKVSTYRDVETPLITAVETMIDFVTLG